MRLGQLARKLGQSPGEIIDFLRAQGVETNEGSNARLDEQQEALIIQRFAPSMWKEMNAAGIEPETEEPTISPASETTGSETAITTPANVDGEVPDMDVQKVEMPPEPTVSPVLEEKVDVIKAPKVELPGLKVVGKIELPEPKKKEPLPSDTVLPDHATESVEEKPLEEKNGRRHERRYNSGKKKEERPRKNSVALQREREAREAAKRKQEEKQMEKERRMQNYLKKVKPAAPTRRATLIDEDVVEMSEEFEVKTPPRTIWAKFMRWLRRE